MEEQETSNGSGGGPPGKRLTRSSTDHWLSGVCGGLGAFFGIDSNLVRVLFAATTLFGGAGVAVYGICWLIIPLEGEARSIGDQLVEKISQSGGSREQ